MLSEVSDLPAMSQLNEHNSPEQRRLLGIAREYRQQGYSVTLRPASEKLPPVLSKCAIDLLAERDDRTVAVGVRTRETLTLDGSEDLCRIADLVRSIPGWEFDLVVTNPHRRVS